MTDSEMLELIANGEITVDELTKQLHTHHSTIRAKWRAAHPNVPMPRAWGNQYANGTYIPRGERA